MKAISSSIEVYEEYENASLIVRTGLSNVISRESRLVAEGFANCSIAKSFSTVLMLLLVCICRGRWACPGEATVLMKLIGPFLGRVPFAGLLNI
jgi:hypothetical protein